MSVSVCVFVYVPSVVLARTSSWLDSRGCYNPCVFLCVFFCLCLCFCMCVCMQSVLSDTIIYHFNVSKKETVVGREKDDITFSHLADALIQSDINKREKVIKRKKQNKRERKRKQERDGELCVWKQAETWHMLHI